MKCFKLFSMLLFVIMTALRAFTQDANVQDSLVLVNLYDSADGQNWYYYYDTGWKEGPVSTWRGVTLINGRVTQLALPDNGLKGIIPISIGNLEKLEKLDLDYNYLYGPIPVSIGNLTNLDYLNLCGDQLSGTIPASIGKLKKLVDIVLFYNWLSDPIPAALGNLTNLQSLDLSHNNFTFTSLEWVVKRFPFTVYAPQNNFELINAGNMLIAPVGGTPTNNTFYWYRDNVLDTVIKTDSTYTPAKAGNYRVEVTNAVAADLRLQSTTVAFTQTVNVQDSLALVDLYDSTNGPNWYYNSGWKQGPVSTWYGVTLTKGRVTALYFSDNGLDGSLPASLGSLAELHRLDLSLNYLKSLPESIGKLTKLSYLNLEFNLLRSLPASVDELINLQTLNLGGTRLGFLPRSFGKLINLQTLYLSGNQLTSLPESFGNLKNLWYLDLNSNGLRSLPASFGNLADLQELYLYGNQLTSLPVSFGKLTKLWYLGLSNNLLRSLPLSFGDLTELKDLHLRSNQLSSLPEPFDKLINLQDLDLSDNKLSLLPESIGKLTKLKNLYLSSDSLDSLPKSLSNLKNLQGLYLESNQLRSLPESFGNLTSLRRLYLTHNQLRSMPASVGNLVNLQYFDLSTNEFTFAPIEWIVERFPFAVYTPQDSIELIKKGNLLVAPVGGTPTNNTFYWYRNDTLDKVIKTDSTYTPEEAGTYRVEAHNAIATQLTLYSNTMHFVPACEGCITWYRDADGDGWGNPAQVKIAGVQPRGYVSNKLDCNDKNKTKGGPEVCDGRDNDCDGVIDNGFDLQPFYSDWDGDGYGTPKRRVMACSAPPRFVSNSEDLNDDNKNVYPGAPEICDGRDNNQNGVIDEGFAKTTFYHDFDHDGYGRSTVTLQACAAPLNYVARAGDCNDRDSTIHPGAKGSCNGIDDDCDGLIDENCHLTAQANAADIGTPEGEGLLLQLSAAPNPSNHYFILRISSNRSVAVQVRIVNEVGRVVEVRQGLSANSTIQIGHNYRPGVYFAEVLQGSEKASLKLVKQTP